MIKIVLILLLLFPSLGMGMSLEKKESFLREARYLLYTHPHVVYRWDTEGGIHVYDQNWGDCSSTIFAITHRIGWPMLRIEAIKMEAGQGGWKNRPVKIEDAEEATVVWWTWRGSTRKHGHVGFLMVSPKSKLLEVVHNSTSQGFHIEPLTGVLLRDLSSVKNLTHGEEESVKLGPNIRQIK